MAARTFGSWSTGKSIKEAIDLPANSVWVFSSSA